MNAYHRNLVTSYGLTILAGRPLPAPLSAAIQRLQAAVERRAPGVLQWYAAGHLHITMAAPMRSRYRDAPALQHSELPADLAAFARDLTDVCAALSPVELALGEAHVRHDVLLIDVLGGASHRTQLQALIARYDAFDPPRTPVESLHVSVGFLGPGVDQQTALAAVGYAGSMAKNLCARVDEFVLVHYANRTLSAVLGEVRLALGVVSVLTEEALLHDLRIAL